MSGAPEPYHPGVLAEDEPRYLRRQKPVEIRRRKFGQAAWRLYAHYLLIAIAVVGGLMGVYIGGHFLLFSPRFVLAGLDRIEVTGNHYVPRAVVLERFTADAGRSVLRMPLGKRRRALEEIPWVARASVQRILPNRIHVSIEEREPVAFLRLATELSLVDSGGVILDRPLEAAFRFPVVTGMDETMPLVERARRMQLFTRFVNELETARPGAVAAISEVDLADAADLQATLAEMPELGDPAAGGQPAVLVHFGAGDFSSKFRLLLENIGQWRSEAGRVESVDLRFDRQVVVNPEVRPAPLAKK